MAKKKVRVKTLRRCKVGSAITGAGVTMEIDEGPALQSLLSQKAVEVLSEKEKAAKKAEPATGGEAGGVVLDADALAKVPNKGELVKLAKDRFDLELADALTRDEMEAAILKAQGAGSEDGDEEDGGEEG